jgi:hypothetical protein
MTIKKTKLDTTNTTTTTGTIQVVDTRNNKVTQATKIKLDVLGPATINTQEFMYSGKEYTYTITTKQPGGE